MKVSIFILLLILNNHLLSAQTTRKQTNPTGNSVLTDPPCRPYVLFPQNSQACPGSDSAFFVTHAYNLDYLNWEKSSDSGLTWTDAAPSQFVGLMDGFKDTLFININDTPAARLLYRAHWLGCTDTTSAGVKIISPASNTAIWTGYAEDRRWENPDNWPCGIVPNSFSDVQIMAGEILISSNVIINSLYVAPGAVLTVSAGFTLTVLH